VLLCDYYGIQLKKPIRYEKKCYSDMRSKASMSQINLQHGTTTDRGEQEEWVGLTHGLGWVGSRSHSDACHPAEATFPPCVQLYAVLFGWVGLGPL